MHDQGHPPINLSAQKSKSQGCMAGLQAEKLSKLIKSLQGLASANTSNNPHAPHDPALITHITAPIIPATAAREEEDAILWYPVRTGHAPPPYVLPPGPRPQTPPPRQTREGRNNLTAAPPLLPLLVPQGMVPPRAVSNFTEMCNNQHRADSLAAYPAIFNLLQDDGTVWTAERMTKLTSLMLQERPSLLIFVMGPTRHLRLLWGIGKKHFSYASKTALYGHIVAFYRDIVARDTPPTISINPNWWDLDIILSHHRTQQPPRWKSCNQKTTASQIWKQ